MYYVAVGRGTCTDRQLLVLLCVRACCRVTASAPKQRCPGRFVTTSGGLLHSRYLGSNRSSNAQLTSRPCEATSAIVRHIWAASLSPCSRRGACACTGRPAGSREYEDAKQGACWDRLPYPRAVGWESLAGAVLKIACRATRRLANRGAYLYLVSGIRLKTD